MASLQEILTKNAAADRDLMQEAADAYEKVRFYHAHYEQGLPPTPEAIRFANAMRVIQLGESIKNLIREGAIDRKEILGPSVSARMLTAARDDLAHPDREIAKDDVTEVLNDEKKALLLKFEGLQTQFPNNANVQSCLNALRHISNIGDTDPSVWKDAGNYMQVICGTPLESMSECGTKVADSLTEQLVDKLTDRRAFLCHEYQEYGRTIESSKIPASVDPSLILKEAMSRMSSDKYREEILGERRELKIEEIAGKWLEPEKGSPQASYTSGCRFVLNEMSCLAKNGASQDSLQSLNDLLEVAKRSPTEIQKFMRTNFSAGLDEEIIQSFDRLNAATQADFLMQKKNHAHIFGLTKDKLIGAVSAHAFESKGAETRKTMQLTAEECSVVSSEAAMSEEKSLIVPSLPLRPATVAGTVSRMQIRCDS